MSKETAEFMAGLFYMPTKRKLKILDAGAGTGILFVALIERLRVMRNLHSIYLVCYENDSNVVELLRNNLDWACHKSKIQITYELHTDEQNDRSKGDIERIGNATKTLS